MKKHKIWKIVIAVSVILIVVLGGFSLWILKGKMTAAKESVLKVLPVPLALVGNRPIYMKDYQARLNIGEKFAAVSGSAVSANVRQEVFDSFVQEQKMADVAAAHKLKVSDKELVDEFDNVVNQSKASGQADFDAFLKAYGLDASTFKQYVLKPEVLSTKLVVWFNQQKDLNAEPYKKADSVVARLNGGEKFEDVAKSSSEDPSSKDLGGDTGFAVISDLLPELRSEAGFMDTGQVKVIASRYGLHVVKLLEKDNNGPQNQQRLHLQQIFVKPNDFNQWFNNETKNIRVKTFINPV